MKCFTCRYAPRFDCGCQYEVCVELLDEEKKIIKSFQPEKVFFQQWNDEPWCEVSRIILTIILLLTKSQSLHLFFVYFR